MFLLLLVVVVVIVVLHTLRLFSMREPNGSVVHSGMDEVKNINFIEMRFDEDIYFWDVSNILKQTSLLWMAYYEREECKHQIRWNIWMEAIIYLNQFPLNLKYLILKWIRSDVSKYVLFWWILHIWRVITFKS